MTLDNLKDKLSKRGNIQICKEGYVFTLLMTGDDLDNWKVVNEIQMEILNYVGDKYPSIEALRNDHHFFCIILTPKDA